MKLQRRSDLPQSRSLQDLLLYRVCLKEALAHPKLLGLEYVDQVTTHAAFFPDQILLQKSVSEAIKICRTAVFLSIQQKKLLVKILPFTREDPFCAILVSYRKNSDYSLCTENHILRACRSICKTVRLVPNSFFSYSKTPHQTIFYLEVMADKTATYLLQKHLNETLPNFLEETQSMCEIPLNEDDILRNILLLKQNFNGTSPGPQMVIHFYRQKIDLLEFVVTLVHKAGLELDAFSLPRNITLLQQTEISAIQSKKNLEALVLIVSCPKQLCILQNNALDYLKAREYIVQTIEKQFGPVRDLNGGLLLQQKEFMHVLEDTLKQEVETLLPLIQELYATLSPPIMRSTLSVDQMLAGGRVLKQLFSENELYSIQEKHPYVYIGIKKQTGISFADLLKIGKQVGLKSFEMGLSTTLKEPHGALLLFICTSNKEVKNKFLRQFLRLFLQN